MAITLDHVIRGLDELGLNHRRVDDRHVFVGVELNERALNIFVSVLEEGEYLDLRAIRYATLPPDSPELERGLMALCRANDDYKIVKFAWDADDGAITPECALPIEDQSTLSAEQLGLLFGSFCRICADFQPKLEAALGPGIVAVRDEIGALPAPVSQAHRWLRISGGPMMLVGAGVFLMGLAALLWVLHWIAR